MQSKPTHRTPRLLLALILLAVLVLSAYRPTTAQAAPGEWRDTGLNFPDLSPSSPETSLCVDPTRPNTLVFPATDGTYTYDWQASPASRRQLNAAKLDFCNRANGLMYGELGGQSVRFSLAAPAPQPIAHTPTHLSEDSSLWAYAWEGDQLWASPDGGLTWQERTATPAHATNFTVATADARVLYLISEDARPERGLLRYTIWQSLDAGATWTARLSNEATSGFGEYGGPYVRLNRVDGPSALVGLLVLTLDPGYPGSSNTRTLRLSSDGGLTWRDLATEKADSYLLSLFYASDGVQSRVVCKSRGR